MAMGRLSRLLDRSLLLSTGPWLVLLLFFLLVRVSKGAPLADLCPALMPFLAVQPNRNGKSQHLEDRQHRHPRGRLARLEQDQQLRNQPVIGSPLL